MGQVTYDQCDECGKERQIDPIVIGGTWQNPYVLNFTEQLGYRQGITLCCGDCLIKYVTKLIERVGLG
jgi:hypothetical protein